jgi:hypothetical protein
MRTRIHAEDALVSAGVVTPRLLLLLQCDGLHLEIGRDLRHLGRDLKRSRSAMIFC